MVTGKCTACASVSSERILVFNRVELQLKQHLDDGDINEDRYNELINELLNNMGIPRELYCCKTCVSRYIDRYSVLN